MKIIVQILGMNREALESHSGLKHGQEITESQLQGALMDLMLKMLYVNILPYQIGIYHFQIGFRQS